LIQWDRSIDDEAGPVEGKFAFLSDFVLRNEEKKKILKEIIIHYSNTGEIFIPSEKDYEFYDLIESVL
jgi:hypothetical protein